MRKYARTPDQKLSSPVFGDPLIKYFEPVSRDYQFLKDQVKSLQLNN